MTFSCLYGKEWQNRPEDGLGFGRDDRLLCAHPDVDIVLGGGKGTLPKLLAQGFLFWFVSPSGDKKVPDRVFCGKDNKCRFCRLGRVNPPVAGC
jgi:hypothetical protein